MSMKYTQDLCVYAERFHFVSNKFFLVFLSHSLKTYCIGDDGISLILQQKL